MAAIMMNYWNALGILTKVFMFKSFVSEAISLCALLVVMLIFNTAVKLFFFFYTEHNINLKAAVHIKTRLFF